MNDQIKVVISQLAYSDPFIKFWVNQSQKMEYDPQILLRDLHNLAPNTLKILEEKNMTFPDELLDWKLISVSDKNKKSGFVGLAFLTPQNEVVLAFRGSESPLESEHARKDWVQTDFAMLKGKTTQQDKDLLEFVWGLIAKGHINSTVAIHTTGHSLGGYHSVNASVYLTQLGYEDQIVSVTNYDDPGFSNKYLHDYQDAIEKIAPKVTNYVWSFVGGTLRHLPNADLKIVDIAVPEGILSIIERHYLQHVRFDAHGNVLIADTIDISIPFSFALTTLADDNPIPLLSEYYIDKSSAVLLVGGLLYQSAQYIGIYNPAVAAEHPENVLRIAIASAVFVGTLIFAPVVFVFIKHVLTQILYAIFNGLFLETVAEFVIGLLHVVIAFFSEQPPVQRLAQRPAIHNRQYAGAAYGMVVFHERDAQRHIKMLENIYHMILGVAHQIPNPERLQACLKDVRLLVSCIEGYRDRITNIERTILSRFEQAHRQAARPSGRYRHP